MILFSRQLPLQLFLALLLVGWSAGTSTTTSRSSSAGSTTTRRSAVTKCNECTMDPNAHCTYDGVDKTCPAPITNPVVCVTKKLKDGTITMKGCGESSKTVDGICEVDSTAPAGSGDTICICLSDKCNDDNNPDTATEPPVTTAPVVVPPPPPTKITKCYKCPGPDDCQTVVPCKGGACFKRTNRNLQRLEKGCIKRLTADQGAKIGCNIINDKDVIKECICVNKDLCNPAGRLVSDGKLLTFAILLLLLMMMAPVIRT